MTRANTPAVGQKGGLRRSLLWRASARPQPVALLAAFLLRRQVLRSFSAVKKRRWQGGRDRRAGARQRGQRRQHPFSRRKNAFPLVNRCYPSICGGTGRGFRDENFPGGDWYPGREGGILIRNGAYRWAVNGPCMHGKVGTVWKPKHGKLSRPHTNGG